MLVLTGFAGRIHTDTLTTKERRFLFTELKSSKTGLIKSVEGLSDLQLNFKPGKKEPSIRDHIYKLVSTEKNLWTLAKASLREGTFDAEKVAGDERLTAIADQEKEFGFYQLKFKNIKEALKLYKNERQEMQKYVNTSTANVRSYMVKTDAGNFDVYQLMLLNTIICKNYTDKIEQIKTTANFPK